MTEQQQIHPHKITKPIQLLAAWLVGLIVIDGMFLATALRLDPSTWEPGFLVICAALNVPVFLGALFILQTRFRAELQEDTYYSDYINKKTAAVVRIESGSALEARVEVLERQRDSVVSQISLDPPSEAPTSTVGDVTLDWSQWKIALNDHLPEFDDIREALQVADIPLSVIFGNARNTRSKPPENWVISISRSMPLAHKVAILRTLLPFRFDGFHLWSPVRVGGENEDVYIGSYGVSKFVAITPALEQLLSKDIQEAELRNYCNRNRVKQPPVRAASAAVD